MLKRIFFGELTPYEGIDRAAASPDFRPVPVSGDAPCRGYRVLYAVGRLPG
jgi:hypothetical protein